MGYISLAVGIYIGSLDDWSIIGYFIACKTACSNKGKGKSHLEIWILHASSMQTIKSKWIPETPGSQPPGYNKHTIIAVMRSQYMCDWLINLLFYTHMLFISCWRDTKTIGMHETRTHAHTHTCTHTHTYICTHTHTHAHTLMHTHTHVHGTHTLMHTHTHTHTHTYTQHTRTHMHTHMHIHTHRVKWQGITMQVYNFFLFFLFIFYL